jgi:hypothetical protein
VTGSVVQAGDLLQLAFRPSGSAEDETFSCRYAGLSVDAEDLICLDCVVEGRRWSIYLGDITELRRADEAAVANVPSVEPPTRRPERPLTVEDNMWVVSVGPTGEEQSGGGDQFDMADYGNGAVCLGYRIDVDEGFGMAEYVGWITTAQLTTKEFLDTPIEEGGG